jgi:hypothetical protein
LKINAGLIYEKLKTVDSKLFEIALRTESGFVRDQEIVVINPFKMGTYVTSFGVKSLQMCMAVQVILLEYLLLIKTFITLKHNLDNSRHFTPVVAGA